MLCYLLAASLAHSQQFDRVPVRDNTLLKSASNEWKALMDEAGIPSMAVAVIKDGKVVLLDTIGLADPVAGKEANIDTRYYIGSITKTMTGTAVLQLVEKGKLRLDDTVQKFLPRFDLADRDYAKTITIRDLLSHAPGIDAQVSLLDSRTGGITEDRFYGLLTRSEAKKAARYANIHFTLLGKVVEIAAGMPWQDYLKQNIYERIGMSRSTSRIADLNGDNNVAPMFSLLPMGRVYSPYTKTEKTMHAAGGTYTSLRDMARYMSAHLNGGDLGGSRLLRASTVSEAFTQRSPESMNIAHLGFTGYGHAWQVGTYRGKAKIVAHSGNFVGATAFMGMFPEQKSGVVVIMNSGDPSIGVGLLVLFDAFNALLDLPRDESVHAGLKQRLKSQLENARKNARLVGPNPAISGQLTLPPDRYVGSFENALFGTVHVSLVGGYLQLAIDDLPQLLKSAGTDQFTAHEDAMDRGIPGKWVVADGKCEVVELQFKGKWEVFNRKAR